MSGIVKVGAMLSPARFRMSYKVVGGVKVNGIERESYTRPWYLWVYLTNNQ